MEDRYLETHITWNKVAKRYDEKFMEFELYDDTYSKFCKLLSQANASILEIGSGPGNIIRQILKINSDLKILATDVSHNMIALAKKNNPSIETRVLDCRNIKTISDKFDGIICGFIIPYLAKKDLSNLIFDCAAAMNESGILYLSFVAGAYNDSGFISGSSGDRTYFYYHDFAFINATLELNKFIILRRYQKEYKKADGKIELHTILLAKKKE